MDIIKNLTALVLTKDGERKLDECLKSLQFCEHILVIDSFSSDKTKEIALNNKAIFIENEWCGCDKQLEFAFKHIQTDFVVFIDQDEICSSKLQHSITEVFNNKQIECYSYYFSRANWYFDRFLKHGNAYPDYSLRLFSPKNIYIEMQGVHEQLISKVPTSKLTGDILHYSYKDFYDQIDKLNRYSEVGAKDLTAKGKRFSLANTLLHAYGKFLKQYFLKLGFLDGKAGFILAMQDFFYTFNKYIRINEPKQ